jgi:hypothetical protein
MKTTRVTIMSEGRQRRVITAALEKAHPGFRVIAGPFDVENPKKARAASDRRAALVAREEQVAAGVPVLLVMAAGVAWVLRSRDGWRDGDENLPEKTKTVVRLRGGNGVGGIW